MSIGGGDVHEVDIKRDIANAYSLLAAIIDQVRVRVGKYELKGIYID